MSIPLNQRIPNGVAILGRWMWRSFVTMAVAAFLVTALWSCGSSAKSTKTSASATKADSNAPAASTSTNALADTTQAVASHTMYINVDVANVRGGPAKDQPVVAKLKFLDPVVVTGASDGDWVEIEVTNTDGGSQKAWVHSSLVSASIDQAKAAHDTTP